MAALEPMKMELVALELVLKAERQRGVIGVIGAPRSHRAPSATRAIGVWVEAGARCSKWAVDRVAKHRPTAPCGEARAATWASVPTARYFCLGHQRTCGLLPREPCALWHKKSHFCPSLRGQWPLHPSDGLDPRALAYCNRRNRRPLRNLKIRKFLVSVTTSKFRNRRNRRNGRFSLLQNLGRFGGGGPLGVGAHLRCDAQPTPPAGNRAWTWA